jgi:exopolyphosphatase/pppGpp-phosphohydrolase
LHFQPQSQINKCNNEKRRRELENEYIEQLGEFLKINKRDMTACKPDKAAILSEVVKKVSHNKKTKHTLPFIAIFCPSHNSPNNTQ